MDARPVVQVRTWTLIAVEGRRYDLAEPAGPRQADDPIQHYPYQEYVSTRPRSRARHR